MSEPTAAQIEAARAMYTQVYTGANEDAAEEAAQRAASAKGATIEQRIAAAQIARSSYTGPQPDTGDEPRDLPLIRLFIDDLDPRISPPDQPGQIGELIAHLLQHGRPDLRDRLTLLLARAGRPAASAPAEDDDSLSADIGQAIEQLQRLQAAGQPIAPDDLSATIALLMHAHTKTTDQE
jgi:hypothetical protein